MKLKSSYIAVIFAVLLSAAMSPAQEKPIQKSDLPSAVQKAMKQRIVGSTVRGYSFEVEDGQQKYEIETIRNGHTRDITFAPDGRILEIEEQVELASLPSKVRDALNARAGSGKITTVESISKEGKLLAYEAKVNKSGRKYEIQVGPDGQRLTHEE